MASPEQAYVVLGVITGAHGIRGEVKLKSFTGDPQAIANYGPLETGGGETLEITSLKPAKAGFTARLKGVADRNQAESLKGTELRLPRDRLPEPGEGEFYHQDLIGLTAQTSDGTPYGEVIGVHDFGAGDLLEIRLAATGKAELIPFTRAQVPEVDLTGGQVVIIPPPPEEDKQDS